MQVPIGGISRVNRSRKLETRKLAVSAQLCMKTHAMYPMIYVAFVMGMVCGEKRLGAVESGVLGESKTVPFLVNSES